MLNTTLCYLERGDCYLMLHRIKKSNDLNHDKWIGVGGKCEEGESPEECLIREVREETGIDLNSYRYRGIITFVSDRWPGEYMHLFTAPVPDDFQAISRDKQNQPDDSKNGRSSPDDAQSGQNLPDCSEGVLEWIPKRDLLSLPIWAGDVIFLNLLEQDAPFFSLKFVYHGENLVYAALNGQPLDGYGE